MSPLDSSPDSDLIRFWFRLGLCIRSLFAINESCSYTLTSAILKIDVVCDVAMTSTSDILTTEVRDLLYNQYILTTRVVILFYLSHGSGKGM